MTEPAEQAGEHRIKESIAERLQLALDAGAIVGTWVWYVPTDLFVADERFARSFGLDPELCQTGLPLDEVMTSIYEEDRPRVNNAIAEALDRGGQYHCEYRVRQSDGLYRWIEANGRVELDADGRALRFPGVLLDIQQRRATEAALAESQSYLRLLLDSAGEAFYAVDREGTTTMCNAAFIRVMGFSRLEDAVGRKLHDVIHHTHPDGSHYPKEDCPIYRTAQTGEPAHIEGELFYRYDGSAIPVEYRVSPIARAGELQGAICTFVDVTERRAAQEALYQANAHLEERVQERTAELEQVHEALRQAQKMEAIGQLTGGIAHDFNNLLAGISGSLELVERRLAQGRPESIQRFVTAAQASAHRATALTQRLLAFSRRQTLDPKPTDINRLVFGMEDLIRQSIGPSIKIEVVGAAGLWLSEIDPVQLEAALLNLAINARDAMPEGGQLTIETANKWLDGRAGAERELAPGQYISICVTDSGTGISKDLIDRIFDPFFTTKPIGQGTGLGLSMLHGFVRQSGGQVRVYSELGHGTTMCLYLPRYGGALAEEADSPEISIMETGAGQTVLVIDDEPTVRMLMVEVLEEAGFLSIEASDGPSGLKILQSKARIDLLVTDVGLPGGMNGRQVADAARVTRPSLKVLFVTGFVENAAVGNGHLELGMEVITKPFVMAEFARKICDMTKR